MNQIRLKHPIMPINPFRILNPMFSSLTLNTRAVLIELSIQETARIMSMQISQVRIGFEQLSSEDRRMIEMGII